MNYATIYEAYGIETMDKKRKKKDQNDLNDNKNEMNIESYNKNQNTNYCEPLQPPNYKIPISNESLESYNKSYQQFLKKRDFNEYETKNKEKLKLDDIIISQNKNENKNNINIYDNYNKIQLDKVDKIEPYYDEDLENYLNLEDFENEEYDKTYENYIKRQLINKKYDLQTQNTFNFNPEDFILIPKKKFETKLKSQSIQEQNIETLDPITELPSIPKNTEVKKIAQETNIAVPIENSPIVNNILKDNTKEGYINYDIYKNSNNNNNNNINIFYKNLINIGLFILIGVFIIFLLDLLTDLAFHKGMKETVNILLPLIEELKNLKDK
jgi:hypothetical protein